MKSYKPKVNYKAEVDAYNKIKLELDENEALLQQNKENQQDVDIERYCTVEDSIEQSLKEIELHSEGKIKLKTLKEATEYWKKLMGEDY